MYVLGFLADLHGIIKSSASEMSPMNAGLRAKKSVFALIIVKMTRGIKASASTEG